VHKLEPEEHVLLALDRLEC